MHAWSHKHTGCFAAPDLIHRVSPPQQYNRCRAPLKVVQQPLQLLVRRHIVAVAVSDAWCRNTYAQGLDQIQHGLIINIIIVILVTDICEQ